MERSYSEKAMFMEKTLHDEADNISHEYGATIANPFRAAIAELSSNSLVRLYDILKKV